MASCQLDVSLALRLMESVESIYDGFAIEEMAVNLSSLGPCKDFSSDYHFTDAAVAEIESLWSARKRDALPRLKSVLEPMASFSSTSVNGVSFLVVYEDLGRELHLEVIRGDRGFLLDKYLVKLVNSGEWVPIAPPEFLMMQ